mmetsp:Transcript_35228/g.64359  ORF Transcript_35228/g.64359 Transcript_35228/m.64359 type:complete len:521 (-) Transcript_35228:240-1802(-)
MARVMPTEVGAASNESDIENNLPAMDAREGILLTREGRLVAPEYLPPDIGDVMSTQHWQHLRDYLQENLKRVGVVSDKPGRCFNHACVKQWWTHWWSLVCFAGFFVAWWGLQNIFESGRSDYLLCFVPLILGICFLLLDRRCFGDSYAETVRRSEASWLFPLQAELDSQFAVSSNSEVRYTFTLRWNDGHCGYMLHVSQDPAHVFTRVLPVGAPITNRMDDVLPVEALSTDIVLMSHGMVVVPYGLPPQLLHVMSIHHWHRVATYLQDALCGAPQFKNKSYWWCFRCSGKCAKESGGCLPSRNVLRKTWYKIGCHCKLFSVLLLAYTAAGIVFEGGWGLFLLLGLFLACALICEAMLTCTLFDKDESFVHAASAWMAAVESDLERDFAHDATSNQRYKFSLRLDLGLLFARHGYVLHVERQDYSDVLSRHGPTSDRPAVQVAAFQKPDVEIGSPDTTEEPCQICLDDLHEGELVGTLPCGHRFHSTCIEQWLGRGGGCPLRCPGTQMIPRNQLVLQDVSG